MTVADTLINGPTRSIVVGADRGQTAAVTTSRSNYDPSGNIVDNDLSDANATGTATLGQTNQTNLAPSFVNPGAGNYHLQPSSLLIDQGTPGAPVDPFDIDGDLRGADATDVSCPAATGTRDIGADEVTIDCVAPDTQITSGPVGLTNDSTPTYTFISSEPVVLQYLCAFDVLMPATPCGITGTFTPMTPLSEGPHVFRVRARDGNINDDPSPAAQSLFVDSIAPATTIDAGPSGPTSDSTPTFAFSSEPGATFECRIDGAAFGVCGGPGDTHTPLAPLSLGAHTFEVRGVDAALNPDPTPAIRSFSVTDPNPAATPPPVTVKKRCKKGFRLKKVKGKRKCVKRKKRKK